MNSGVYMNMPEKGGVLNQSPLLMTHIEMAWRVWKIMVGKLAQDHTEDDKRFMNRWVFSKDK